MKLKFKSNRKAFTLVELLIVIAIIGILFVVLVSKVDFATDKANATGVQTDFRSFQIAFETVSRENSVLIRSVGIQVMLMVTAFVTLTTRVIPTKMAFAKKAKLG